MTPDFLYNNFRAIHASLFGPCFFLLLLIVIFLICLVRFGSFLMVALWSANAIWAYLISQGLCGHGLLMGMRRRVMKRLIWILLGLALNQSTMILDCLMFKWRASRNTYIYIYMYIYICCGLPKPWELSG